MQGLPVWLPGWPNAKGRPGGVIRTLATIVPPSSRAAAAAAATSLAGGRPAQAGSCQVDLGLPSFPAAPRSSSRVLAQSLGTPASLCAMSSALEAAATAASPAKKDKKQVGRERGLDE